MIKDVSVPVRTLTEIYEEIKIADREIAIWRSRGSDGIAEEWESYREKMQALREGRNLIVVYAAVLSDGTIKGIFTDEDTAIQTARENAGRVVVLTGEYGEP